MRIVNIETIQHNIHMIITPRPLCPGLWHWQLWCRPARHHDREHFYNISTDFSSNPLCLRRSVFQSMFLRETSCRLIFANTVLIVEMVFYQVQYHFLFKVSINIDDQWSCADFKWFLNPTHCNDFILVWYPISNTSWSYHLIYSICFKFPSNKTWIYYV